MNSWKQIFWSSLFVSGAMGLGRILGCVREILIAGTYGKTYDADVVVLTLTIPDILLNFLVAGALSITIMPELVKANKRQFITLILKYHLITGIIFCTLAVLLITFSHPFIALMAPGLPPNYEVEASSLLKISVWSIPLIVWSGITSSSLNSKGIFLSPALGTVFFNFIICIGISFVDIQVFGINSYLIIAYSIVLGALFRWLIQLQSLSGLTRKEVENVPEIKINYSVLVKRYGHAFFATSSLMVFPILARLFASKGGEGQLANLNYVQKLIDVPLSLVVGSFTLVLLPKIIKSDDRRRVISMGVSFISISCAFISMVMFFLSKEIIVVLFGYGAFTEENVLELAKQLKFAVFMFPFYGTVFFLSNTLAVTSLAHFSSYACLLGVTTFWVITNQLGDFVTPDKIYQNLLMSYLLTASIQILIIYYKKDEKCFS